VTGRDLIEPQFPKQRRDPSLVLRIAVSVHEQDGGGANAAASDRLRLGTDPREIGRPQDLAIGGHALVDFDHAIIEHRRQANVTGKNLGPILVADAKRIAEPLRHEEYGRFTFALEQRVGRDGGTDLHRFDSVGGDRHSLRQPQ
jgi:hypothetical protein